MANTKEKKIANNEKRRIYRKKEKVEADFQLIRKTIETNPNVSTINELIKELIAITGSPNWTVDIIRSSMQKHPRIQQRLKALLDERKMIKKKKEDTNSDENFNVKAETNSDKISDAKAETNSDENSLVKNYVIDLSIIGGFITDGDTKTFWYEFIEKEKDNKFIITNVTSDEIDKMIDCGGDSTEAKMAKKLAKMSLGDNFEYVDIPSYKKEESSNDERDNYIVDFCHAHNCHLLTADIKMATWAKRKSIDFTLFEKSHLFYQETQLTPFAITNGQLFFRGTSTENCKYFVNKSEATSGYTPLNTGTNFFIISCKNDYGKKIAVYKINDLTIYNTNAVNAVLIYKRTYTTVKELPKDYRTFAL